MKIQRHEHDWEVKDPTPFNVVHHHTCYCNICGVEYWHDARHPQPRNRTEYVLMKLDELLCAIGCHDWQPLPSIAGGMGWGAGHPMVCTRCGKGGTDSDFGVY